MTLVAPQRITLYQTGDLVEGVCPAKFSFLSSSTADATTTRLLSTIYSMPLMRAIVHLKAEIIPNSMASIPIRPPEDLMNPSRVV